MPGPTGAADPGPPIDPREARQRVLQNAPSSGCQLPTSFVARLFDDAHFDPAACRALEEALAVLARHPGVAAETDRHVFALYRLVVLKLLCHLDPGDVCRVDNLDDDAAIDLRNRFDFVVGRYFFREPFEVDAWWRDRGDTLATPAPG